VRETLASNPQHQRFLDHLLAGEEIRWLGSPAPSPKNIKARAVTAVNWTLGALAAAFLAGGMASKGVELVSSRLFPRWSDYGFGLFLIILGLAIIYGALALAISSWKSAYRPIEEFYALSNRRALILRQIGDLTTLTSIPIMPNDWITVDFGPRGRIIISRSQFYRNDEDEPAFDESTEVFKDIPDAKRVFDLIREIQTGTADPNGTIPDATVTQRAE
jgi:hypothetical protein